MTLRLRNIDAVHPPRGWPNALRYFSAWPAAAYAASLGGSGYHSRYIQWRGDGWWWRSRIGDAMSAAQRGLLELLSDEHPFA